MLLASCEAFDFQMYTYIQRNVKCKMFRHHVIYLWKCSGMVWYILKVLWHHAIYFESTLTSCDIFWKCSDIVWNVLKVFWHHSWDIFWKCSGIMGYILKVLRHHVICFEIAQASCDIFWKCSAIMWYILKMLRHHVIYFESALTSCDMLSRVGAVCAILVSLNNSTALRGIQNSSLWKIASLSWNHMFHDKMYRNC